jgi:hypothetical protein
LLSPFARDNRGPQRSAAQHRTESAAVNFTDGVGLFNLRSSYERNGEF